jgi:uncharacterized protein
MFISIAELQEHPIRYDESYAPGVIDYLTEGLQQVLPLHMSGRANLVVDEIELHGQLRTAVEAQCARCLDPVRHQVEVNYDLVYQPMSRIARREEIAVPKGEEEIAYYQGHGLLLEDVAKEQVLLALPMASICQEGRCRGLCPVCGGNLNREVCNCRQQRADPRWEGLSK